MGPYVVFIQNFFWKAHQLVEEPPVFRLALGVSGNWAAGIWIELDGWHRCAEFLESAASEEWRCPSGFSWDRSFCKITDPENPSSIIGERENYAARWSDDLIGFHISFYERTADAERDSVRMLMSAMTGAAIIRRGPPPGWNAAPGAQRTPAPATSKPWWKIW